MPTPERPPRTTGLRRWRVGLAALAVGLSFALPADWIEAGYSRGLYPWIQRVLVPLSGAVAWPCMGTALVALPFLVAATAIRRTRRARAAGRSWPALLGATGLWLGRRALYVYALFLVLWGYGYQRVPIERRWQLGDEAVTAADVHDVQERLIALLQRDAKAAGDDHAAARRAIAAAEQALVQRLEGFAASLPRHVKHPPAGALMAFGIYGVVSPFTLEAHVDPALPLPFRLGIDAHELAHLLGYCGEADANLVAFVAGLNADDPLARYGTALTLVGHALYADPSDLERSLQLQRRLPERARKDLAAVRAARERQVVRTLSKLQIQVNDTYLKSQGVSRGVADYERGFTLFVRAVKRGLVELPAVPAIKAK